MLRVKLHVIDRTHPQSNKFAMGLENKATSNSKLNDSPELGPFLTIYLIFFCIDDVSSSTTDVTPNEQEAQDQAVPGDVETSKLASIRSDTSEAESVITPGLTLTVDQLPASDQTIPDRDSYISDVAPVGDASVRLQRRVDDKILVYSASKEAEPTPETTGMDQVVTCKL